MKTCLAGWINMLRPPRIWFFISFVPIKRTYLLQAYTNQVSGSYISINCPSAARMLLLLKMTSFVRNLSGAFITKKEGWLPVGGNDNERPVFAGKLVGWYQPTIRGSFSLSQLFLLAHFHIPTTPDTDLKVDTEERKTMILLTMPMVRKGLHVTLSRQINWCLKCEELNRRKTNILS